MRQAALEQGDEIENGCSFCITSYHALSPLITPCHALSIRSEKNPFYVGNFKISSQAANFLSHLITSYHSLSHLITAYPLDWKENHFTLATLKLVPRLQLFYHIFSIEHGGKGVISCD